MRFIMFLVLSLLAMPTMAYPLTEFKVHQDEIVSVYDGDTFTVTLEYWPDVFGKDLSIRLVGIDTPEMKSKCKTTELKAKERAKAIEAKLFMEGLLRNAKVIRVVLAGDGRDKYFRLDAQVFADDANVGDALISNGLAVYYDGTTARDWCAIL